jgi:acyl-CoA synthetase (NDP forming)
MTMVRVRATFPGHSVTLGDTRPPPDFGAVALPIDADLVLVPEPAVKGYLRRCGLTVPAGRPVAQPDELPDAAAGLEEPLVVKAFGPGIVHKSRLGAIRLGVTRATVVDAGRGIVEGLAGHGLEPAGFLVEEQVEPGLEVLIGAAVTHGVPILLCGRGGVDTEALDVVSARLLPLDEGDVEELLPEAPGFDALRETLWLLAGSGGTIEGLVREGLLEFECNPVILGAERATVADARLILGPSAAMQPVLPPARDLRPLFSPATIAIAGVSSGGRGLGNLALEAYRRVGWTDGLYVLHPQATEISGVPALRTLADVPGGRVDYLKVVVPASETEALVAAEGRRAGVVQVISGGFTDTERDDALSEQRLVATARVVGVPLVGPNCIGVYCPAGRQTFQLHAPVVPGTVAVVSQSGGVCADVIDTGAARGIRFSKVLSVGNALDVTPAEVVDYLVDDPDTSVIGVYVEDMRDWPRFVAAARRARGRKPIVLLAAGSTAASHSAAVSHTGAMTTDRRFLDALQSSMGVIRVASLEALVSALLALQWHSERDPPQSAGGVLVMGHGGGNTVLAADACGRAGLHLGSLEPATAARLAAFPGSVVKNLVNPLEVMIGPNVPVGSTRAVLEACLEEQAFSSVLLHCSARSFLSMDTTFLGDEEGGIGLLLDRIEAVARPLPHRPTVVLAVRAIDAASTEDRRRIVAAAATARLPVFFTVDDAVLALLASSRFDALRTR